MPSTTNPTTTPASKSTSKSKQSSKTNPRKRQASTSASNSNSTTLPTHKKARVTAPSTTTRPPRPPRNMAPPPPSPPAEPYLAIPKDLSPLLEKNYEVQTMRIISSSKMSSKISRSLSTLLGKIDFSDTKCKPGLVVLYARAPVGAKLVSVVEVVKREVERENYGRGRWWQYSGVGEEIIEVSPKSSRKGTKREPIALDGEGGDKMDVDAKETKDGEGEVKGEVMGQSEEESEPYFEPLKKGGVMEMKKYKAEAVLTVYLSRVPIKELKAVYGEQTNSKT